MVARLPNRVVVDLSPEREPERARRARVRVRHDLEVAGVVVAREDVHARVERVRGRLQRAQSPHALSRATRAVRAPRLVGDNGR